MENQKHAQNQGLLDALESLSAALSVVSSSVDMVREELQAVLSVLSDKPTGATAAPVPIPVAAENSPAAFVEKSVAEEAVERWPDSERSGSEGTPTIYLLDSLTDDVAGDDIPVTILNGRSQHEMQRQECLTCAV